MVTLGLYSGKTRKDFLSFKKGYKHTLRHFYETLQIGVYNCFFLCRITDEVLIKEKVNFFVESIDETGFTVRVPSHVEDGPEFFKKYIRHDNVLGEFPLHLEYEDYNPIDFGTHKHVYLRFKNILITKMKQYIGLKRSLYYLNDNGTQTIIDCVIKEVNRSNFLCEDFCVREISANGEVLSVISVTKTKNHRFISTTGFLYQVGPSQITPYAIDDGETFGETPMFQTSRESAA